MENNPLRTGMYGAKALAAIDAAWKYIGRMTNDVMKAVNSRDFGLGVSNISNSAFARNIALSWRPETAADGEIVIEPGPGAARCGLTRHAAAGCVRIYAALGDPRADGLDMDRYGIDCVVDFLDGVRPEKLVAAYGRDIVDAVAGQPRNPFQIEAARLREADLEAAAEACRRAVDEANDRHNERLVASRRRRDRDIEKCRKALAKKVEEIDARYREAGLAG